MKEIMHIKRSKNGQINKRTYVEKEINKLAQENIDRLLMKHIERLYWSQLLMKLAIFSIVLLLAIFVYSYVNFTHQIVQYLGGL